MDTSHPNLNDEISFKRTKFIDSDRIIETTFVARSLCKNNMIVALQVAIESKKNFMG